MSLTELVPWLGAALALVVLSALFHGTEVALFGLRRVDREQLGRSGRTVDAMILRLLGQPRRLVVSVLIGTETVNLAMAAIAVQITAELLPDRQLGLIGVLSVAAAAPLVLMFAVIVPKTVAIKTPIAWARAAVRALAGFAWVISPVRWLIQGAADVLAIPLGGSGRPRTSSDLSEEEFRTLVDAGSAQGQVDARERRLIHRVFEFGDKNVGQVMTPRDKVFALSYELPMGRLSKEVAARGFSRVPIYQRSLDNVRGILNAKDLVLATAGQPPGRTLIELLHDPLFVPRTTPLARLFTEFKQRKVHMALVVSEYGKLLGLVTMEDLLEQLFGEIRDERESLQAGKRGRGGRTPLPGTVPTVAVEGGQLVVGAPAGAPASSGAAAAADEAPSPSADPPAAAAPSAIAAAAAAAAAPAPVPAGDVPDFPPEITKPLDKEDLADLAAEDRVTPVDEDPR